MTLYETVVTIAAIVVAIIFAFDVKGDFYKSKEELKRHNSIKTPIRK